MEPMTVTPGKQAETTQGGCHGVFPSALSGYHELLVLAKCRAGAPQQWDMSPRHLLACSWEDAPEGSGTPAHSNIPTDEIRVPFCPCMVPFLEKENMGRKGNATWGTLAHAAYTDVGFAA